MVDPVVKNANAFKSEARNPKFETNPKFEIQMSETSLKCLNYGALSLDLLF